MTTNDNTVQDCKSTYEMWTCTRKGNHWLHIGGSTRPDIAYGVWADEFRGFTYWELLEELARARHDGRFA